MTPESKADRPVHYGVAMSLDGYIAGPKGEADWIVMDPDMDFAEMMGRFDTLLIGRKTFTAMQAMGGGGGDMGMGPGMKSFLISRTLRPEDHPDLTIVEDAIPFVAELKTQPGKDIWLFGGGELCQSLLGAGLVDAVGVAVIPVLLGEGIPFIPSPAPRTKLALKKHQILEKTGTVCLEYEVVRE